MNYRGEACRVSNIASIRGSTLIEVLISFLIVTSAIYGYIFSEQQVLKQSIALSQRMYVSEIVETMMDKMRANGVAALNGRYGYASTSAVSQPSCSVCSSDDLAKKDIYWFDSELNAKLGSNNFVASIQKDGADTVNERYTLTVSWSESPIVTPDNADQSYQQSLVACRAGSLSSECL